MTVHLPIYEANETSELPSEANKLNYNYNLPNEEYAL